MAKRIKVTGKTPRGLSKAERIMSHAENENYRMHGDPGMFGGQLDTNELIKEMRLGKGATRPSSTRKKLVKEGNRKFIGPRQLSSELAENREANVRASEGAPVKYIDRGPGRAGHIYEVDEGGIMPFETSRREIRQLSRLQKETNPASKRRVNEILRRILDQYLGGGQEFDAQD